MWSVLQTLCRLCEVISYVLLVHGRIMNREKASLSERPQVRGKSYSYYETVQGIENLHDLDPFKNTLCK